ncbi:MAG TPA: GH1 family beta-glucosidase [Alphaproteobacteria bacterium]|nr:GH1 family beta-glucosidase [Alphaproteobacteria bacterium]
MITRRAFGGLIGGGAALGLFRGSASAVPSDLSFPQGFRWGCSTAAYQIEGAVNEDGRGPSIWDIYSHTPGKVMNGDTGDVACDSYRRYREDTQLLKNLGATAYRFSIAWPRIFPEGRGKPNPKGVDHYKRVVDNLLENGIEPYVTLFHWDLPAALPGGWQSRDTAHAFADYAGYMASQLSDRVGHFMTTNEFRSFVDSGYAYGILAPGLRLPSAEVNQIRHHALLAHGLGVQAIRAHAKRRVEVGLAEDPTIPVPAIGTEEHIAAARTALRKINGPFLTAIMEGQYPEERLAPEAQPPKIAAGDMAIIGSPLDFVGLNVYAPTYVRAAPNTSEGYELVPRPRSFPTMLMPWLMVGPEVLYWAVRLVSEVWKPRAIFITENGCAADDALVEGQVNDTDRVTFLRNYISNLRRAAAEGYPVRGYFAWSLLDNFEWAAGYTKRFGIHYTDYKTEQRIPKLSAAWYRELIKRNALV